MIKSANEKRPPALPAVALLIETSNRYARELLQGIRDYVHERGCWTLHLAEQGRGGEVPPWLENWDGQGVIARVENRMIERAVRALPLPAVNVSAGGLAPELPSVVSDSKALTRLAAEHLMQRGFRNFAYCGDSRFAWSKTHGTNFASHIEAAGYRCDYFDSAVVDCSDWRREQAELKCWLRSLPKPVAIMACYDIRGQHLLNVCRRAGLRVPDEIAVIGQHNDEALCELCDPPLSSVMPNARLSGKRAAGMLDRLMRGETLRTHHVETAPLGVATRRSTDVMAIDDAEIAQAARFIREHACQGIGVEDVLKEIPLSRSVFERRFRKATGISPYEAIQRRRLECVRELLLTTDLPVGSVAERAGFSCAEYMSAAFKRNVGSSPRRFREKGRALL
jgi:LacI family transcriptional regulator